MNSDWTLEAWAVLPNHYHLLAHSPDRKLTMLRCRLPLSRAAVHGDLSGGGGSLLRLYDEMSVDFPSHSASGDSDHDRDEIARQAADWLSRRLDAESWSGSDEERFQEWLRESPQHEAELRKSEMALDATSIPGPGLETEISRVLNRHRRQSQARRIAFIASGAVAAIATVVVLLFWISGSPQIYETGVAEQKTINLSDGTTLELDAMTSLEAHLSRARRRIVLHGGRAVFHVARDKARTFEVEAGTGLVKVVGTVFEVNLIPTDLLEVAVQEGVVDLGDAKPSTAAHRLTAGTLAAWNLRQEKLEVSEFNVDKFGQWRSGRLVYRNRPFKYVLADLEREYRGEIVLKDPSLGEMPVTGTLRTQDLSQAFALLSDVLPIRVSQSDDDVLMIERRPEL